MNPLISPTRFRARRPWAAAALLLSGGAGLGAFLHLRSTVRHALEATPAVERPLRFVAVPAPAQPLDRWGSSEVEAVAATAAGLVTAGGAGVWEGSRDVSEGLPTLRASALALWRGQPVVALASGGLFLRRGGEWEEAGSGWGRLHVRALAETPAGELLIGAREGLFRAAWGGATLEKLDAHPVRSVALEAGHVLAAGEEGLHRVEPGRALGVATPDPWVEWVGLAADDLLVVTAAGLARGPRDGPLQPVAGGEDIASGVLVEGTFWGVKAPADTAVRRFEGRPREERLPAPVRRLLSTGGVLLADTEQGLYRRTPSGWVPAGARPAALPAGSAHVSALALRGGQLVAGFFDAGLAVAMERAGSLEWRAVPGSAAWGVNALLPAGGALYVASLRGAARFDGARLRPVEGPGAAFSLAATDDGVAIGYGQGVLLPGARLLSAFHGLPGNQALALASGRSLFVGTPSGLGAVEGRRVAWRVTAGEGKLPHPWVSALALSGDELYVGTYGGGVVRRTVDGRYEPFVETEGLKITGGCLMEADGRLYAGTDGGGLYRLAEDKGRFVRLDLPLPSPRITALLAAPGALYIGTDEGLARLPLGGAGIQ